MLQYLRLLLIISVCARIIIENIANRFQNTLQFVLKIYAIEGVSNKELYYIAQPPCLRYIHRICVLRLITVERMIIWKLLTQRLGIISCSTSAYQSGLDLLLIMPCHNANNHTGAGYGKQYPAFLLPSFAPCNYFLPLLFPTLNRFLHSELQNSALG